MRLLTLCFPTTGKDNDLHLTVDGQRVILAPDEFHAQLLRAGWGIDVVSLAPPTEKRLHRSGLPLLESSAIKDRAYDLVWHMFRDPTQPEALAVWQHLRSSLPSAPVPVNHLAALAHHHKLHYLPILARYGLAPDIVDTLPPPDDWTLINGNFVDPAREYISTHAYNNNRGDYPERGHGRITLRFVDNERGGIRSFVRFGVAYGQGFAGFEYFSRALAFRSGMAESARPYRLSDHWQGPLAAALAELHCDVCHVEAVVKDDRLYVFDVNPFPTAHGKTLTEITKSLIPAFAIAAGAP